MSVEAVLSRHAKWHTLVGDARETLRSVPDGCAQTCVTSPPYYGLRDYGAAGQIGQDQSPAEYVAAMVAVMRDVRRVLADDGTLWLNVGDSYAQNGASAKPAGSAKPKDLIGIPWRLAFALQDDGWYLRSDIVWAKPNPMPESVLDRPTRAHEYVFLLTKRPRYFYDADAIRDRLAVGTAEHFAKYHATEIAAPKAAALRGNVPGHRNRNSNGGLGAPVNGRNARDVWTITPEPFAEAHFATMPPELARRCILAGSRKGDVVLDPFGGAATTAYAALREGRRALLCELNPDYVEIQRRRLAIFDADAVSPVRVEAADFGPLFGSGA